MKKSLKPIIFTLLIISLALSFSCGEKNKWEHINGHFSTTPVNLTFLNTFYDDYNSTLNQSGETFPLCFSSNRKSAGGNFDIVYKLISIMYDWESQKLDIELGTSGHADLEINNNN